MKEEPINTILDLFERSCRKFPENAYLWEKKEGKYQSVTYAQTREEVRKVAAGWMAWGLKKGERVALLSEGCSEWIQSELGILYAGGINVPLSMKLNAQELIFRICHSEARFLVVSDYYRKKIEEIETEIPQVEKVFVIRYTGVEEGKYYSFERLKDTGRLWLQKQAAQLEERSASVQAEEGANISYTSGTTADPKGILLTHGNYVCNVLQADSLIQIPEHYKVLLFLPWDHSFAHTVGIYSFMYNGASLAAVDFGKSPLEYLRNIPQNMREIQPEVLLSVPALAKNFRRNIEAGIQQQGLVVRGLYRLGLKWGYRYYGNGSLDKRRWKFVLWPLVKGVDQLIFTKIRKSFGGKLQFFIGGGALLDVELQRYYSTLGIPMYQGYGLSEASPVVSSNTPRRHRFGSSGQVVQPMELKICDEAGREVEKGEKGEIVIRGGNVMKGYWKNLPATQQVLRDGWLYTGDMGYIDEQGLLYVLGRFKSLLIAEDGEKYSPEGIEEAITELSPVIDYCVLYHNQSLYTAGLVVPNKKALQDYISQQGCPWGTIETYKLMLEKIQEEILKFRKGGEYAGMFPERWLPAVVAILPETFNEENGMINSTAKVVRHKVYERFREELEYVYTPEGKDIRNSRNTKNIKRYFESC